jgi:predicted dehydrogenase
VAVVGCGGIGRAHARAYAAAGVPAIAFIDPVPAAGERVAAESGAPGALVLKDVDELPPGIDVVSITTPPPTHYALCKRLLESGRHVWCEKPLAMDVDQARELATLAERLDRVLLVGFKYRFESVFRAARAQLPRLGQILAASCVKAQAYPRKPVDWVADVGVMYELSIHDVDLLNWYLGPSASPASGGGSEPEYPFAPSLHWEPRLIAAHLPHRFGLAREDQCFLTLEYPGGVTAQIAGVYSRETRFLGRDVLLTVVGERGFLRVERPDRITLHLDDYEVIPVPTAEADPFTLEARNLLASVAGTSRPLATGWDGYRATHVVEAARAWTLR